MKISRISKRFSIALILIVDSFVVAVSGSAKTPNAVRLSRSLSAVEVNGAGFGSAQPAVLVLLISNLNVIANTPRVSGQSHMLRANAIFDVNRNPEQWLTQFKAA